MPEATLSTRAYLGIFALALFVRMSLFFAGPYSDAARGYRDDSHRYRTLATNLQQLGAFGKQEEEGLVHTTMLRLRQTNGTAPRRDAHGLLPETFRTPGYPAFLASIHVFTDDVRVALVVQCLLGASLAAMVAAIALVFGIPRPGAILAGVLWAVHPVLAVFDLLILTESLFNFCAVAGIFLAARARGAYGWGGSGFLVGLAALVRPLGLLYLPFGLFVALRRRQLRWTTAIVMCATAVLPSTLWAARNWSAGEGFRVSTVGDVNLLYYAAGYALSEEKGDDWLACWPIRVEELSQRLEQRLVPGQDVFSAGRTLAVEELEARPTIVVRMEAKSTAKVFLDHSIGELMPLLGRAHAPSGLFSRFILGENHLTAINGLVFVALLWTGLNLVIAAASAVGLIRLLRRGQYSLALACALLIAAFLLATMSVGTERMRLPMMLPLFLLTASAVWPPAVLPRAPRPVFAPGPEAS
jgi:hypothetical protein